MAQPVGRARRPRLGTLPLFWLVPLAGTALVTGFVGLRWYHGYPSLTVNEFFTVLYQAVQLFVFEFDAVEGAPVPWVLQLARFLAPVATFVAAGFAAIRTSWWLQRNLRWGYSIVVGDTAEARAVAEAKRQQSGRAVFEVPSGDLAALRAAGVRRARTVYACGDDRDDVAANVAAALAAVSESPDEGPFVYAHVTDPELAVGLRARRLMTAPGQRVEFFSTDELAAQAHVASESFPATAGVRVLVAGAGAFGRAVIVALARRWRGADARLSVLLVDASATAARQQLLDRWPVVGETCDLVAIDADHLDEVLRSPGLERPYRAYICYEDEHVAVRSALAAVPLWHGGPGSLVVRLSRLARHAEAFRSGGLLDDLGGRLVVANVAELAAPEVVADRDIFWQLAEAIHERYLVHMLRAGTALGATPSLRPWAELNDDFKDANYDQARHLAVKLHTIAASVAPRSAHNPPLVLTDSEVELLARMEHDRWLQHRRRRGWRYGPERIDAKKIHPNMTSWEELPEDSREKDRSAVRGLPAEIGEVLAEFGLQIVRLAPAAPGTAVPETAPSTPGAAPGSDHAVAGSG